MASLAGDHASIRVVRDMVRIDSTRSHSDVLAAIGAKIGEQRATKHALQRIVQQND